MDVDGLWLVAFKTEAGWKSGGVLALVGDRMVGGDSSFYYVGDSKRSRDADGWLLDGTLKVRHYDGSDLTSYGVHTRGFDARFHAKIPDPGGKGVGNISAPPPGPGTVAFHLTRQHNV